MSKTDLTKVVDLLKNKRHHILSKDYHDGHGRKFWLRDDTQRKVCDLTAKEVAEIKIVLPMTRESVMSSDEAFILATDEGHKAWS